MAREAYGEVKVEIEAAVPVSATAVAGGILSHGPLILLEGGDRPVSLGVETSAEELPLDVRVPVVLDLVVGPPGQSPCYQRPSETHTQTHRRARERLLVSYGKE